MRAKEFIVEYKQYPLEDFQGLSMKLIEQDHQLIVMALDEDWGNNELGYVIFNIGDNDELDPQELFVNENYRGQGVARKMYDFVTSHGYEIHKSPDVSKIKDHGKQSGEYFWQKHRGEKTVWESQELDEYDTGSSVHIDSVLQLGNDYNSMRGYLKPVNVPLQGVNVKYYRRSNGRHSYFMFNDADRCVGVFSLDEVEIPVLSKILAPGVKLVTPHMTLSPQLQRTGIATQCYTTFLNGGPWVFVTKSHSEGAKSLWDKLSMGNYVTMYYYEDLDFHGRLVKDPSQIEPQEIARRAIRVMGPRDRFKNNG